MLSFCWLVGHQWASLSAGKRWRAFFCVCCGRKTVVKAAS
jgi:hypothetical protein